MSPPSPFLSLGIQRLCPPPSSGCLDPNSFPWKKQGGQDFIHGAPAGRAVPILSLVCSPGRRLRQATRCHAWNYSCPRLGPARHFKRLSLTKGWMKLSFQNCFLFKDRAVQTSCYQPTETSQNRSGKLGRSRGFGCLLCPDRNPSSSHKTQP